MERNNAPTKRYQPYARPASRRQQAQPAAIVEEELFQNIPKVIVSFVKKSLSWLGITQGEDPELDKELHTTNGDFEFLPAADKDGESSTVGSGSSNGNNDNNSSSSNHRGLATSSSGTGEKLYPDLRDYITSLKSTVDDQGFIRHGKRSELEADMAGVVMAPERQAHRSKLRKGLETMGPEDHDLEHIVDNENPFFVHDKDTNIGADDEDKEDNSRTNSLEKTGFANQTQEAEIEGLSKEELILLGRIRKLTETPLERARRNARASAESRLQEEKIAREFVTPYSLIRLAREEPESTSKPTPKPLDTIMPYNKEHRRRRPSASARDEPNDHAMDSGDSDFDADESDHAKHFPRDRSRPTRRREKPADVPQSSPSKMRRTSRPELHEDQRTSRNGLQIRSNVTPKRHIKSIPGRFSALDTDEEEEDVRQELIRRAKRKEELLAYGIQAAAGFLGISSHEGRPSQQASNGAPSTRAQPQIYPNLQFGPGRKLYNPKLDEVIAWTSSPHESTGRNKPAEDKESFASSIISEVVSAAPAVISGLAAAAGATGVAKLASEWASSAHSNQKSSAMPAQFATPFSSNSTFSTSTPAPPISTEKVSNAEKDKDLSNEQPQPKTKDAPASGWGATAIKMPDTSDKWKCPTCDVRNANDMSKCPCCDTDKPGAKAASQMPLTASAMFGSSPLPSSTVAQTSTSAPPLFSFGATSASSIATSSAVKTPIIPAFLVPPTSVAGQPAEKPASPIASGWGATAIKMSDNSEKWKCPTCDVRNGNDLSKCPCCDTPKPGGAPVAPAAPSMFSFKAPTFPALPATSSFGVVKPASGMFGASPTTPSTGNKPPMFSFGAATPTPAASTGGSQPASTGLAPNPFAPASTTSSNSSAAGLFGSMTTPLPTSTTVSPETPGKLAQPAFAFGISPVSVASTSASLFSSTSTAAPSVPLFGNPGPASTTAPAATSVTPASESGLALLSSTTPASMPLFGNAASAAPSSTPMFGGSTTSPPAFGSSLASNIKFGGASTAAPMFGSTTTTAPSNPFGTSSTASLASAPASSTPLFSIPTSATPVSSVATSTPAATPLFGTPAIASTATTTSNVAPTFGSLTSSPFAFGPAKPPVTFGQSSTAPSTPAATTATSTPGFTFGSAAIPVASTGPSSSTLAAGPTGFGSGFSGFGAAGTSATFGASTTPSTTQVTTPSAGYTFGGSAPANQTSNTPSFTFGSASPAAGTGMNTGGAFGSTTKSPAFTFGTSATNNSNSAAGAGSATFGGFGVNSSMNGNQSNQASSSMMSPTMSNATPVMGGGSTTFGGFGSTAQHQTSGMGFNGPSSTLSGGFGATASTPSTSFGSTANSGGFGTAPAPFGQSGGGFGASSMGGGFGSSGSGFNGSGGFGSSIGAASNGVISLAGPSGSTPAFGATAGGFGTGMQSQPQQQPSMAGGGYGFGGGNGGQFGFQGASNAPGGPQYAQPAQQNAMQPQPMGGFSFNMGTGPAPGEVPANRKIAKMRKKR